MCTIHQSCGSFYQLLRAYTMTAVVTASAGVYTLSRRCSLYKLAIACSFHRNTFSTRKRGETLGEKGECFGMI